MCVYCLLVHQHLFSSTLRFQSFSDLYSRFLLILAIFDVHARYRWKDGLDYDIIPQLSSSSSSFTLENNTRGQAGGCVSFTYLLEPEDDNNDVGQCPRTLICIDHARQLRSPRDAASDAVPTSSSRISS